MFISSTLYSDMMAPAVVDNIIAELKADAEEENDDDEQEVGDSEGEHESEDKVDAEPEDEALAEASNEDECIKQFREFVSEQIGQPLTSDGTDDGDDAEVLFASIPDDRLLQAAITAETLFPLESASRKTPPQTPKSGGRDEMQLPSFSISELKRKSLSERQPSNHPDHHPQRQYQWYR